MRPGSLVVLASLLLWSGTASMAGDRMASADIDKTFRGMTLDGVYDDGSFFSETYFEDGTIRYHDTDGADSGEWSVKGDTFCTYYEDQQGACFFVDRDGQNCFTFHEAIEDTGGRTVPRRDWASRGWNRDAASTCPTPPSARI